MRPTLAAAALLVLALPAAAQVNEAALARRAAVTQAACDAVASAAPVSHPARAAEVQAAARARCVEEREVRQHLLTMEQCQRGHRRANVRLKSCMNEHGYEVAD